MNSKLTKWMMCGVAGLMVSAGVATADETQVKVSSDKSTNPITGTVKETRKKKKSKKVGDAKAKEESSTVKKTGTDGSVEVKEKTESESSPN